MVWQKEYKLAQKIVYTLHLLAKGKIHDFTVYTCTSIFAFYVFDKELKNKTLTFIKTRTYKPWIGNPLLKL